MNFIYLIKKICKKYPDNNVVIENGKNTTYKELWEKIKLACKFYQQQDIKKGDRILILLPNSANFLIYHYAALKMGAISVPMKTEYKIYELSKIVDNCAPRIFVTWNTWLNENSAIFQELKYRVAFISIDDINLDDGEGVTSISSVRNNDLASINYSYSGDGYPKGAALDHGNHIYAAIGYSKFQRFTYKDNLLIILPMPHVYTLSGCLNSSLIAGGTITIIDNLLPKSIFRAIEDFKVTVLSAIPVVFEYLARYKRKERYDLSSLRLCVTGGELMPEDLQYKFEKLLKTQIVQGYGLTECLPLICNPAGRRNKRGTLGIPGRKDIKIKIVNEKNEKLLVDQTGEILIKSPTTMLQYYNLPDDTKKVLKDGWFYTGDIGKIDKDGHLYFCGLKKKIYNIYGNNIDPLEIKNVLLEHPLIEKANIFLKVLPDEDSILNSKIICADICIKNGLKISSTEIRKYCMKKIAAYKVPERINIYN